jgi:hypothetical protein
MRPHHPCSKHTIIHKKPIGELNPKRVLNHGQRKSLFESNRPEMEMTTNVLRRSSRSHEVSCSWMVRQCRPHPGRQGHPLFRPGNSTAQNTGHNKQLSHEQTLDIITSHLHSGETYPEYRINFLFALVGALLCICTGLPPRCLLLNLMLL